MRAGEGGGGGWGGTAMNSWNWSISVSVRSASSNMLVMASAHTRTVIHRTHQHSLWPTRPLNASAEGWGAPQCESKGTSGPLCLIRKNPFFFHFFAMKITTQMCFT